MKFLNEQGQEVSLKQAENLPGYEVTLAEDTVIDSAVNNPFFKGINILQLPKKLKGFRNNPDLQKLLQPKALNTGIKMRLNENEFVFFSPAENLVLEKRLLSTNQIIGQNESLAPLFINFGLKKIKLDKNTVIGTIIIQKTSIQD